MFGKSFDEDDHYQKNGSTYHKQYGKLHSNGHGGSYYENEPSVDNNTGCIPVAVFIALTGVATLVSGALLFI